MHHVSCTNTHHDVTGFVKHGLIKNTKIWISRERNIIFLSNKKILNLYLRWYILRNYCFVAEVTFSDYKKCQEKLKINSQLDSQWKVYINSLILMNNGFASNFKAKSILFNTFSSFLIVCFTVRRFSSNVIFNKFQQ